MSDTDIIEELIRQIEEGYQGSVKDSCVDFDVINYVIDDNHTEQELLLGDVTTAPNYPLEFATDSQLIYCDALVGANGAVTQLPLNNRSDESTPTQIYYEVEQMHVEEQSLQTISETPKITRKTSPEASCLDLPCLQKTNRGRPLGKLSDYLKQVEACHTDKRQIKVKKNNVSSFLYRQKKNQTIEEMKISLEKNIGRNVKLQSKYKKNKQVIKLMQEFLKQVE